MSLAAHRPARSLTAIATEAAAGTLSPDGLPRLPRGVTLDVALLDDAACQDNPDPDLFFPDLGDTAAIAAAKRLCAAAEALELARQVGVRGAARQLGVCPRTLHNTWRRWQLGTVTSTPQGARLAQARRQDDPWHRATRARLAALNRAAASSGADGQPGNHLASPIPARSGHTPPERTLV